MVLLPPLIFTLMVVQPVQILYKGRQSGILDLTQIAGLEQDTILLPIVVHMSLAASDSLTAGSMK
jgi:hypothetical protein